MCAKNKQFLHYPEPTNRIIKPIICGGKMTYRKSLIRKAYRKDECNSNKTSWHRLNDTSLPKGARYCCVETTYYGVTLFS